MEELSKIIEPEDHTINSHACRGPKGKSEVKNKLLGQGKTRVTKAEWTEDYLIANTELQTPNVYRFNLGLDNLNNSGCSYQNKN